MSNSTQTKESFPFRSAQQIINDIKELKIQGARRIAKAAVDAVIWQIKNSKAKTTDQFHDEIVALVLELEKTRPTEPMMRNSLRTTLRFILSWLRLNKKDDLVALKSNLLKFEKNLLDLMDEEVEKLAQIGSSLIKDGSKILVHCHSNSVVKILQNCFDQNKNIEVSCLETRPLFQGRLTARELSSYGIKTNLYVDGAVGSIIQKHDLVLVGADAITAEGDLINKIGTFTIAQVAKINQVKFFSAAEIFKYDPLTRFGIEEIIEQRDYLEVWGDGRYQKEPQDIEISINDNLKVYNPSFDRTPAAFISAYICEEGLIPPPLMGYVAEKKLKLSLGDLNESL
ncbi:MAG: S-methyl-5-thioribose-1-phosphate isomerase [Candidatus Micrarchaeota archaeon]|nr:S-methyl-5-thioribose-1-phosphate isomerase [Candidatus Micrarchaeota archaeon]